MIIRRLIVPALAAAFAVPAAPALAQGAFPAPLPSQSAASPFPAPLPNQSSSSSTASSNSSVFPPVNGSGGSFPAAGAAPIAGGGGAFGPPPGAAPMGQQAGGEACMNDFLKLRKEAEKRGQAIQAAGKRKAPATEACKLIGAFASSEVAMIKYVVSNAKRCGIPNDIADQLKTGHKRTEQMQKQVCNIAEQQQRGPAGPSFADVLGSSTAAPEANTAAKKFGGTTFDTLNGNVLAR